MKLIHEVLFKVKEQALCMLANIADGEASKTLIMDNEDMMKKLKSYMQHFNPNLQVFSLSIYRIFLMLLYFIIYLYGFKLH